MRWSTAGRLRAERSLARSRVARGLLRGREGPYRYRSCRFRAASPSQPELTELNRAAGSRAGPESVREAAPPPSVPRESDERARIQRAREREEKKERDRPEKIVTEGEKER